ncbi:MAG: type II secretion system F family protein [Candidatus Altiarchaeota archaeon]
MPGIYQSKKLRKTSQIFQPHAKKLVILFPDLEWDLKKAGYTMDTVEFLSVSLYLSLLILFVSILVIVIPLVVAKGVTYFYISMAFAVIVTAMLFVYLLFQPKAEIQKRGRRIDRDLEYLLKDMKIQLSSGVPLFDTIVNVGGGRYGECSDIADGIVQEVESGKSISDVLDDVGLWSPSEYLRNVLWQIVNAVRSGSDIKNALEAISNDIRIDKENKIKAYAQELNLWGLIYMMVAVVMPSMGVTLLIIMSSFVGAEFVTEPLFWFILLFLTLFQIFFISYVQSRRPTV